MKHGVILSKLHRCLAVFIAMLVIAAAMPSVAAADDLPKAPKAPKAKKAKKATDMRPIRDVAREQREYREKKAREAYLAKFSLYKTPYHDIHTDQSEAVSLETAARMKAMVKTYIDCTSAYSAEIKEPMVFLACKNPDDYYASGGDKDTTCVCVKNNLVANMAKDAESDWSAIQYEGFRQFSRTAVSRSLPQWVDRGLACYFSDGIWAGDEYVTGVIPEKRLAEVKKYITEKKMLSFVQIFSMNSAEWKNDKNHNEIQAWSMVYFLLHAENGRHKESFDKFMKAMVDKKLPLASFRECFGRDLGSFQKTYEQWWTSLPDNPTVEKENEAAVRILTNFLALAEYREKTFIDMTDFATQIKTASHISMTEEPSLWLPDTLLGRGLDGVRDVKQWSLDKTGDKPALVLKQPDGTTFTGTYTFVKGLPEVKVKISRPGDDKNGEVTKK